MTYIIKQNITKLNHGISSLQNTAKNGPKQPHQIQEHYSEVVSGLQNRLANLSVAFKDVLEQRTEVHVMSILVHFEMGELIHTLEHEGVERETRAVFPIQ